MKKIIIILILALLTYSGIFWFVLDDKIVVSEPTPEVIVEEVVPVVETPVENKLCFSRSQVATKEAPYAVEENVEIVVNENLVSGTKSGTQAGPDMTNGYEGTLSGEIVDNVIAVMFSYTVEGSNQKEKEEYIFEDQNLVKLRYTLKDDKGILVPDKTDDPIKITYTKSVCK